MTRSIQKSAISLQKLIHRNYLRSALLQMFVIEVILLLLYFGINQYISTRNQEFLLKEVTTNLLAVVSKEASNINLQLQEITRLAQLLQQEHQTFFAHKEHCFLPNGEPKFRLHDNGAYYKTVDNGGSSVYYAATTSIGKEEQHKAQCSESMDILFKSIVNTNPIVNQIYLNTWDEMNRIYPFIQDAAERFGPIWDVNDLAFYFSADAAHNPQRFPVWTNAYLDPVGQGWVISNIVPIYRGDFLEGVTGMDVRIDRFIHSVLNLNLSWDAAAFLVDKTGAILAMPKQIEQIFGFQETPQHSYQEPIVTTIRKPIEYNILKINDQKIRDQIKDFLNSQNTILELLISEKTYFLIQTKVSETGWNILVLVHQEDVFAPIEKLRSMSNNIGYVAIGVMIIFYMFFFMLLLFNVRKLANKIVTPIHTLSEATTDLNRWKPHEQTFPTVGILELDQLNHNFNNMVNELDARTDQLASAKQRERLKDQQAEVLEQLATTDLLTEIYNRRKIEEILTHELMRSDRYQESFGIILCDIDHFKAVNDQYGHLTGDKVLFTTAQLLKTHLRKTDAVGRWGGEEFLAVCPVATRIEIQQIAEKLRQAIAAYQFPVIGSKTASFGVAIHQQDESMLELMNRADEALYCAKAAGRNRVEIAS